MRPVLEIDLDAVCANYRTLKSAAPTAEIAAVVKCDAYGLGAEPVSAALAVGEQCKTFFVAYAHEGAALRQALAILGVKPRIFVFNGPHEDTLDLLAAHDLSPVINSRAQARLWAGQSKAAPAAVHVDTGMNRLGAAPEELSDIASTRGLKIVLAMSHLACGSDPGHAMNEQQHAAFESAMADFGGVKRSLAASAGAFMGAGYHYDLIRAGIALYGVGPFDRADPRLAVVATLAAPVVQVATVEPGESLGYGAGWTAGRRSTIATLLAGYGDGVHRAASPGVKVYAGGALCPVVGRISMDLITVDVTDAPEPVEIGDKVEIFGQRARIEDAAAAAGTIGYELLTGLGARALRRYVWRGAAVEPGAVGKPEGQAG